MYDDWQSGRRGFEAMVAKAGFQAQGLRDWLNYYETVEGSQSLSRG